MGEGRDVYRVLIGRTECRRPLGRLGVGGRITLNWEIGISGTNWIQLAQDRVIGGLL
jgi:hypothetical protein